MVINYYQLLHWKKNGLRINLVSQITPVGLEQGSAGNMEISQW